jgi:two-component system, OmpR family, phosphate regulon sensor histidine kinase PhoR
MDSTLTVHELEAEVAKLQEQLDEANETIEAIRTGQVDGLIIKDNTGHQLYTLKSADQTYRVFIEKMKEGAVTLDTEGLILYSNSSFASMLQVPLMKVIGQPFQKFILCEQKDSFNIMFSEGWKRETKGELFLLNENGEPLPTLISLTTLHLDEGIALSIIITDLTVQKQSERQLKLKNIELQDAHYSLAELNRELESRVAERTHELSLSREYFKFMADTIPAIVWTAGPNGEKNYFNKRWYEYTGTSEEEIKSVGWQHKVHPEDLPGMMNAWNHSLQSGEDYHVEARFQRASDGAYRWFSGTAVPFRNDNNEVVTWFGISIDIDEQKVAMKNKDEFISMASHELKTPVTIIKAFSHMLLSTFEKDNTKAMDFMGRMNVQIDQLESLIVNLLDASKVNGGMMVFDKIDFDFNELVREVAEQIQFTTQTHSIELILPGAIIISGDRGRLSQVLTNLINNGIKYSPKASKIIVSIITNDHCLNLAVRDFGIGIPADQQPKLFHRFFRASEGRSNTFPGLGLGLYISNEIVKRHSGSLTFTSEAGKGSTFNIELPVKKAR